MGMRQLLYISSARQFVTHEAMLEILTVSRANNRRDELCGLLWSDDKRFLQVLEGEAKVIDATLQRIRGDSRHHAIVILHDRKIAEPTFARWSMALLGDDDEDVSMALSTADMVVRGTFNGLIQSRRAA